MRYFYLFIYLFICIYLFIHLFIYLFLIIHRTLTWTAESLTCVRDLLMHAYTHGGIPIPMASSAKCLTRGKKQQQQQKNNILSFSFAPG